MTLTHPNIVSLINGWQNELRQLTNKNVVLLASDPGGYEIPFNDLIEIICSYTGVPFALAIKDSRKSERVFTRHLIAYYGRVHYGYYLNQLAGILGGLDHTTIINSVKKMKGYIDSRDAKTCEAIAIIELEVEKYKLRTQRQEKLNGIDY